MPDFWQQGGEIILGIGIPELILIVIIALVVFGPKKLPEIGKAFGKGLSEFRKATSEMNKTITEQAKD